MKIFITLLAAVVLATGAYFAKPYLIKSPQQKDTITTDTIKKRTSLTALGRLEPGGKLLRISAPVGEIIDEMMVKEDQEVKKGTILFTLSRHKVLLMEKAYIESLMKHEIKAQKKEQAYAKSQVAQARFHLQSLTPSYALKIKAQNIKIQEIKDQTSHVKTKIKRQKGILTEQDIADMQLQLRNLKKSLSRFKVELDSIKREASDAKAKAQNTLATAIKDQERLASRWQIEPRKIRLKVIESQLENTIIRAPRDGKILKVLTFPGEIIGSKGVILFGNTKKMYAIAEIYQTDVHLLKLGQKVNISSPALPKKITGTVEHIGNLIYKNEIVDIDPTADQDVRVMEVKVRLDYKTILERFTNLEVTVQVFLENDEE